MAGNFEITSMNEWENTINTLQEAYDAMEFASEKMKAVVQNCLLQSGITGDLVPILMEKYDEDVLGSVRTFQAGMSAFIKTHKEALEDSEDLDRTLNERVEQMASNRQQQLDDYRAGV